MTDNSPSPSIALELEKESGAVVSRYQAISWVNQSWSLDRLSFTLH